MLKEKPNNNIYDFDEIFYKAGRGMVYKNLIEQMERPLIKWVLNKTEGNQIKAASILGLNRNTFRVKMRKLGILPEIYKRR